MIAPTIEVNKQDIQRFADVIKKISDTVRKPMFEIVKQATVYAVQSTVKATKPGTTGKVSNMADKYRYRPIEQINNSVDGFYWYINMSGKVFKNEKDFGQKAMRKGLNRITGFYKYWNKKTNSWGYFPATAGKATGYNKSSKKGRIPNAGAGKAGWLGSYPSIGLPSEVNGKLTVVQINKSDTEASIAINNLVDYIEKTSPDSARIGLQKAENKLVKRYEQQLKLCEGY